MSIHGHLITHADMARAACLVVVLFLAVVLAAEYRRLK
jgi:hypothetical protein